MSGAINFEGLSYFALYLGLSLAMLAIFTRLYIWATPYHEPSEIAKGKMAPAIALAGAMLGFTFPLLVASFSRSSVYGFVVWSVRVVVLPPAVTLSVTVSRPRLTFLVRSTSGMTSGIFGGATST